MKPDREGEVTLSELELSYKGNSVLKGMDYTFTRNRITGIIGPSGSGKTTLLRTINRMNDLVPDFKLRGKVFFEGRDIYENGIDVHELRQQIGMVFQKPCIFPQSIYKNVTFGLRHLHLKKRQDFPWIVEETLKEVSLWNEVKSRLHEPAITLSQGQQQRLCIARSLAVQPRVLLMDEPTSALDPKSASAIEQLISRLTEKLTIIFVTHNLQQARRVSDEVVFICDGIVCETGKAGQIFENPCKNETMEYLSP